MAMKLNILKPSVNNMTVRVFVRAAGPRLRGAGRVGVDDERRVHREVPGAPDADDRGRRPPARHARRELRDHGLPLEQARPGAVLSVRSGQARGDRQRELLFDRDALSAPHARDVPGARLPAVPRRGGDLRGRRRDEGEGRQRTPPRPWPGRSRSTTRTSWPARSSSAATARPSQTSASRRPSSSCGRSTTTCRRGREEYMTRMEETLGEAYSEPAADVRGYIEYVKSRSRGLHRVASALVGDVGGSHVRPRERRDGEAARRLRPDDDGAADGRRDARARRGLDVGLCVGRCSRRW